MRVIAVDWSGAARAEHRHLWVAEVDVDGRRVEALTACSRVDAADRMVTRAEADAASGAAGGGLAIGLDFGFSLPAWFLDAQRIATAAELWGDAARLERWLAECRDPFWGRPGRPRPARPDDQHFRRTELATVPRPRSVFQIGGAGAVGTASLRGMPVLARLQQAGCAIWPFDLPRGPVVLEVWPRLAIGAVVKSRRDARQRWLATVDAAWSVPDELLGRAAASDDAFDALAAALQLAQHPPAPPDVVDPDLRREGWIWGVPLPGRAEVAPAAPPSGTMAG